MPEGVVEFDDPSEVAVELTIYSPE